MKTYPPTLIRRILIATTIDCLSLCLLLQITLWLIAVILFLPQGLFAAWLAEFLMALELCYFYPTPHYLIFLLPIVMPITGKILWKKLAGELSPGEHLLATKYNALQINNKKLFTGSACARLATMTVFATLVLTYYIPTRNNLALPFLLLLPILFCSFFWLLSVCFNIQSTKSQPFENPLELCEPRALQSNLYCLALLIISGSLFAALYYLSPSYFIPLINYPHSKLLFGEFIIWLLAGTLFVRYWHSPKSSIFYAIFFAAPTLFFYCTIPAILTSIWG